MAGPNIDASGSPNTFSSTRNVSATGLTVSGSGTAILAWLEFSNAAPGTVTVSWNFTGTTQHFTLLTSSAVASSTIQLYGLVNPTVGNKRLSASWGVTGSGVLTAMSFGGTFTGSTSGTGTSAFPNPAALAPTAQTTTVTINGVPGDYTAIGAATAANPITFATNSSITRFVTSSAGGAIAPIGQWLQARWSVSMPSSAAVAIVSTDVSGPGSSITQYWMRPESSDFSIDFGLFVSYPSWTNQLETPPSLYTRSLPTAVASQLFGVLQPIGGLTGTRPESPDFSQDFGPFSQAGTGTSIGWDQPLDTPYLRAQMPTAAQPTITEPVAPPPLGIIGWYQPLSAPPAFLAPRALPIALRTQTYTAGPLPIIPPVPFFAAYRDFPVPSPPIPNRAVFMPPATGPPANYAYDRWFPNKLSEPPAYLAKPALATAVQQAHSEPITAVIPPPPVLLNVHSGLNPWAAGSYVLGQRLSSGSGAYQCTFAGNSTAAPTGFGTGINNGGVAVFKYLSNIDYTSMQAAANAIMNTYAVGGLTANQIVWNWNDTPLTVPLNGLLLNYFGIASNGFTTTFTCAPGESFRDSPGGSPLTFNAANGVSFDAPITGAENAPPFLSISVANVTLDGLQLRDLNPTGNTSGLNGSILVGALAANITVQNCILDGYRLVYAPQVNCSVLNSLLVNEQTQQATDVPMWPIVYDTNGTGKLVNCTCIGFNPTGGTCSMVTTLGNGPVQVTNCVAFGLPDPFFCQNTGGSITVDHSPTSVASFTADGCTDGGGNLFGRNVANQFINPINNFRPKTGADIINAGRTDLVDIPSAQDIFRTSRPQAGTWDAGAVQTITQLVWLSSLSGEVSRQQARTPGQMGGYTAPVSIAPETTTVDRYHQPLSRIVPAKPGLLPHLVPSAVEPIAPPTHTTEATSVDRWLAHYPERAPGRAIHPSAELSSFAPITTTFPENITRDRWTPVYPDRAPGRAIHPSVVPFATFAPVSPVFRETTSIDRWYSPLSTPQLWRTTFREQATATEAWIAVQTIPVAKSFLPTVGSVVVQGYGPRIKRKPDLPHA